MTPPASSLHYTVGPVIAFVVVALLAVVLRWIYHQRPRKDPFAPDPDPTGLLVAVATVPDRPRALALRAVLSDAGIRSTIREQQAGRRAEWQVLVFPADADRARLISGPYAGPGPQPAG